MSLEGFDPFASPLNLLEKSVADNAKLPAIVHDGGILTYADLGISADEIVKQLKSTGASAGDRVALYLGNSAQYLAADLALMRLQAVKVPLNQMLSSREVLHIINHSGARAILTSEALVSLLPREEPQLRGTEGGTAEVLIVSNVDSKNSSLPPVKRAPFRIPTPQVDPGAPAVIFYTGGTTGEPKGVLHTHGTVGINLVAHVIEADIRHGEQMLLSTPLSHAAGVFAQAGLIRGATIHLLDRFDPAVVVDRINEGTVTWTFMVPTMMYRVLDELRKGNHLTRQLDTLVYGAAPIAASRLREAIETFGPILIQFFGQTECPNFGTTLSKADHERALRDPRLLESCGRSSTLASARVVTDDGVTATGVLGEVCLSAPYIMREYYRNPEATADTRREGWIHTGDLGIIDDDDYIYLRDRRADMIISGGMNVYTTEVEAVIQELDEISNVAVIGIPHADWGEAVCAVIVTAEGKDIDSREVIEHCKARLATYKRPKHVEFVDEIPTTPFGKPDKKVLRSKYWDDGSRQIS